MPATVVTSENHGPPVATLSLAPGEVTEKVGIGAMDEECSSEEPTNSPAPSKEFAQESLQVEEPSDDNHAYPEGLKLVIIILALCLAVFLAALDQTIISTAIPKITDTFHSVDDIGWYGSSYLLTRAALQPTFGRIYSTFSIKYTLLASIAIFELGSLVCGVAPTSNVLIIGRAIAGVGVGSIFTVPLRKRPAAMGVISSMWSVASVAGPFLGGVFTQVLQLPYPSLERPLTPTQRSSLMALVFFYQVILTCYRGSEMWLLTLKSLPIGALSLVVIAFVLDIDRDDNPEKLSIYQRILKLDLIGAVIIIPATICLLLPLQWGGSIYAWDSARIIGLFAAAGCLICLFIFSQVKLGDKATLPLSLFKNRNVLCAFIFSGGFGAAFYPLTFYLSVYFQSVKNSTALHTGIKLLPLALSCTVSSIGTGFLISAVGYYTPVIIVCIMPFSIGAGLLTTLAVTSSYGRICGYQILTGLGIGVGFEASIIVVQTVLPGARFAEAISCVSFSMTLGGAIFLPVAQALFQNGLVSAIEAKQPQLDAQLFLKGGATEIRSLLAFLNQQGALDSVLQAYVDGVKATFWVSIVGAIVALVAACGLEWKSVKNGPGGK